MRVRLLIAAVIIAVSVAGTLWLSRPVVEGVLIESGSALPPGDAAVGTQVSVETSEAGLTFPDFAEPHPLSEVMCPPNMVWLADPSCSRGARSVDAGCDVDLQRPGFCIDRFEYPNQEGVRPAVLATFAEAEHYCDAEGKRLCLDSEWTAACRGIDEERQCNVGAGTLRISIEQFRSGADIAAAFEGADGRRPSAPSRCAGPHGVFDMLGNVREWVRSEHPAGYAAALKGGHYNQVSIGCDRSIQTQHPFVRYPTTGLRCCADALVDLPGPH